MESIDKDYYVSTNGLLKKIKDFPGYWVSEHGVVYSEKRKCFKPLKPKVDRYGYLSVRLYKDATRHEKRIHRLVAEAFISNPDNLPIVNHIDEDKWNNAANNLEWSIYEDNMRYSNCKPVIEILCKKYEILGIFTEERFVDLFENWLNYYRTTK